MFTLGWKQAASLFNKGEGRKISRDVSDCLLWNWWTLSDWLYLFEAQAADQIGTFSKKKKTLMFRKLATVVSVALSLACCNSGYCVGFALGKQIIVRSILAKN